MKSLLILCHELGHAYGGSPYLILKNTSAEGQADYYATHVCFDLVSKYLERDARFFPTPKHVTQFTTKVCNGSEACLLKLSAGIALGKVFAQRAHQDMPDYETPDKSVVRGGSVVGYPSKVQCRLDTFFAGVFDLPRPACWYDPHDDSL